MSLTTQSWLAPAHSKRRAADAVVPTGTPPDGSPLILTWALAGLAAAERRVAELEARLAYLEGLTITDELTRLLNRRGFLVELGRALETARSGGQAGVVMICDLDGFKAVNDRHGHNAGNRVLRELSASLIRQLRRTDAVARLGGDEFGFLLTGALLPTARNKAETLERSIATLDLAVDGAPIKLSASFGLVAYDGSETEEALLHRADMAMYAEKRRRTSRLSLVR